MTEQHQHRATPEQWALTEILELRQRELRDRIQSLETHIAAIEPLAARTQAATGSVLHLAAETSKLGHRVEALEATQHAHIEAGARCAVEQMRSRPGRWQPLKVETTYGAAQHAHIEAKVRCAVEQMRSRPGSWQRQDKLDRLIEQDRSNAQQLTLVERVQDAIGADTDYDTQLARAAIRVVAEWLRSEYPQREGYGTAWANLLHNEAS